MVSGYAGEHEKNLTTEEGLRDADAARQSSGVVDDNATAEKDDDLGALTCSEAKLSSPCCTCPIEV